MQKRTLGNGLEVSALGLGCMGMSQSYLPIPDRTEMIALHPRRGRARRHVLRHRAGVRAVRERGARRRGARAGARPGRDRDEVRLRLRRAASAAGLDSRPETSGAASRTRSSGCAPTRSTSSTSTASIPNVPIEDVAGAVKELIDAGKVKHFGLSEAGVADHPPRARRAAGDGAAERVLALVARAGGRDPADARGARDRLRPVQPARQGLPHREDRRDHDVRRAATSATPCRASTAESRKANRAFVDLLERIAEREGRDAGADRARVAARAEAVDRADPRHDEAAPARGEPRRGRRRADAGRPARDRGRAASTAEGARYSEAQQRMIDR